MIFDLSPLSALWNEAGGGGEAHRQICRIGVWDLGEVIQAGLEALPGTRPTHLVVSKPLHGDVCVWKVFYYASARFAWNKSGQVSLNLQRPQTLAILASMHLNLRLQSGFRPILIRWFPLASHHPFCLEWWNVGKEVRLRRKQELTVPSCSGKKNTPTEEGLIETSRVRSNTCC